jgi:hypothetical protein
MLPDDITRGIIFKQETRNALFFRKLTNLANNRQMNLQALELKFDNIYIVVKLILFIQCVQCVQQIHFYLDFENTYFVQISDIMKSIWDYTHYYTYTKFLHFVYDV